MEPIERELIAQAQGGDTGAFRQLVERNQRQIINMAMELTGNWADADDLAQMVFIKAYRGLGRFRGRSQFQSWLYRIMVNTHIDEGRKRQSRGGWEVSPAAGQEAPERDLFIDNSAANNPQAQAEARHIQADIEAALQTLAPQQRSIFVMRHYQDLPLKEIAGTLGVTVGTVKSQLFRALRHLQERLAPYRSELGLED